MAIVLVGIGCSDEEEMIYRDLEAIVSDELNQGWTIRYRPSDDFGPWEQLGLPTEFNVGMPAKGTIGVSGSGFSSSYEIPGEPGISFMVIAVRSRNALTYVVLQKQTGLSVQDPAVSGNP